MKRNYFAILITATMAMLVGCAIDPATYYFNADELKAEVSKIELLSVVNENPKEVTVDTETTLSFNRNNATFIKELDNIEIKKFIEDLSTITFHIENISVNSPVGYTVVIYIDNEEMIVLSCTIVGGVAYGMVSQFTTEEKFIKHIAKFADEPKFRKLIGNYFDL